MATRQEVADHFYISTASLSKLIKQNVLPSTRGPKGFDLDECRRFYLEHLKGVRRGIRFAIETDDPGAGGDMTSVHSKTRSLDMEAEKARKEKATADKIEIEVAEKRGELIPVDEFERHLREFAVAAANRMDAIVGSLITKYPELSLNAREGIREEIAKARNSLAALRGN